MVAGERHLGGADEVEVVGLEVVDLVGVLAEEAGAGHDLGLDQRRRDHGVNPASIAWCSARLSSASWSRAPTPVRK